MQLESTYQVVVRIASIGRSQATTDRRRDFIAEVVVVGLAKSPRGHLEQADLHRSQGLPVLVDLEAACL